MTERCPDCGYTDDRAGFEGWEMRDRPSPVFTLRCPKCEALLDERKTDGR